MPNVSVREELETSADLVWAEIQDFGTTQAWLPAAKVVDIQGAGAGAVRRVQIQENIIEERCEAHDPAARRFSYRLLSEVPEIRDYRAAVEVEALSDGSSALTWSCSFDCAPDAESELRKRYEDLYRDVFIASVREHLAALAARG